MVTTQSGVATLDSLIKEKRLGRFRLDNYLFHNNLADIRLILKDVIVLEAQPLPDEQCIEYVALGWSFKPVKDTDKDYKNEEIPLYNPALCSDTRTLKTRVRWRKEYIYS